MKNGGEMFIKKIVKKVVNYFKSFKKDENGIPPRDREVFRKAMEIKRERRYTKDNRGKCCLLPA